ncbi:hypothetical protein D3C84_912850 [compost metagenome]
MFSSPLQAPVTFFRNQKNADDGIVDAALDLLGDGLCCLGGFDFLLLGLGHADIEALLIQLLRDSLGFRFEPCREDDARFIATHVWNSSTACVGDWMDSREESAVVNALKCIALTMAIHRRHCLRES